eukprot:c18927_g1_i1.p1 GENE.c18927_g1_i1~~c18927_g1_i1.p1  ORF type:complete len:907 (+),score=-48.49 c18927_g1_i1:1-2721(+)
MGGGPVAGQYASTTYVIFASIVQNTPSVKNVPVLGSNTALLMGLTSTFSNIQLQQPTIGAYTLTLTCSQIFTSLSIHFNIIVGLPNALNMSGILGATAAAPLVDIPSFTVSAVDAAGNFVGDSDLVNRTISIELEGNYPTTNGKGVAQDINNVFYLPNIGKNFTMTMGVLVIPASALVMISPAAGRYNLLPKDITPNSPSILITDANRINVFIDIIGGSPASLVFISPPPAYQTAVGRPSPVLFFFPDAVVIQAYDSADNSLSTTTSSVVLRPSMQGKSALASSSSNTFDFYLQVATMESGRFIFTSLGFQGIQNEVYTMNFTIDGNGPLVQITQDITVVSCESELPNSDNHVGEHVCECKPGYYFLLSTESCVPCSIGEYKDVVGNQQCQPCDTSNKMTTQVSGASDFSQCLCRSGYVFEPGTTNCINCPIGATCLIGQPAVTQVGYYLCTPSILEYCTCPYDLACPAGINSSATGTAACELGYDGVLCGVCAAGYGGIGNQCDICLKSVVSTWVVLLILVSIFGTLLFFFLRSSTDPNKSKSLYSLQATMALKIGFNYAQQLAFISGFQVPWPSSVDKLFQATSYITLAGKILALSCAVPMNFYTLTLLYMIGPFLSVIAIFFLLKLYEIFHIRHMNKEEAMILRENTQSYSVAFAVAIVFMSHPNVTRQVFQIFYCIPAGHKPDGTTISYLASDLSERCGTAQHKAWSAICAFFLIVYSAGTMIIAAVLLASVRERLSERAIFMRFSLLYQGFRKSANTWEIIIIARKMMLVIVVVFGRSTPIFQNLCGQLLFFFAILAQLYVQPHVYQMHHYLELLTLFVTYFTITTGALFGNSPADSPISKGVGIVVIIFCSFTFIVCILTFCFAIAPLVFPKVRELIDNFNKKFGGVKRENAVDDSDDRE